MYSLKPLVLAIAVATSGIASPVFALVQDSSTPVKPVNTAAQNTSAEAEFNAGEQERDNDAFSSLISADEVGKAADQHVAGAGDGREFSMDAIPADMLGGNVLYQSEDYGRRYQVGINYNF